ncbi:MAG: hypothetical protein GY719_38240 [bacterium]|nr:hypothetical protein [bacterium]
MFYKSNVSASIAMVWLCTAYVESADAGINEWTSQGPYGGFVHALAIDPMTPSTLYAGSFSVWTYQGHVFKSTDNGVSWTGVYSDEFGAVFSLAIDPVTPSTLYAGSWDEVLKSTDAGASWTSVGLSGPVQSLAIDPVTPSTLYAGTRSYDEDCLGDGGSVFKSTDGGSSWAVVNIGLVDSPVEALVIDPTTPSTIYVATLRGVYRSQDGGASWTSGSSSWSAQALVIDPITPSILYAASFGGVYKSTDGGSTWEAFSNGLGEEDFRSLVIDPIAPATLYVASKAYFGGPGNVYKSTNGGGFWARIDTVPHPIEALAIHPSSPSVLYGTSIYDHCYSNLWRNEGVFRSTDGAASWVASNIGLSDTFVESLAIDPVTPTTLYAGSYRGGVDKSTNGGASWIRSGLSSVAVGALAVDPVSPSILYAGDSENGYLYQSTDSGMSWALSGLPDYLYVLSLAIGPSSVVYAGTDDGVYKSTNGGSEWAAASDGLTTSGSSFLSVHALVIDVTNPAVLIAGTTDGVFQTMDGGGLWTATSAGLPDTLVWSLVIDPIIPTVLYAGTGDGVFRSTDSGGSWFSAGLPETRVTSLAIDPDDPSNLYAATDAGVYRSTGGGDLWVAFDNGLENVQARALVINSLNPSTLYAATDRGVFDITQVEPCVADATTMCLNADRFRVEVDWRDYDGNTGSGQVVPVGSDDSGLFWFFSEDNWEMLIKVLDGCALNDRFWVFAAATTDVEYTLRVTDTAIGAIREYFNPLGTASPAITDAAAFDTCSAGSGVDASWAGPAAPETLKETFLGVDESLWEGVDSKGLCVPNSVDLCLNDDRFLVEVEWRDYDGNTGSGQVVPVDSRDSGILWFFSETNWEMLVKVLDGCGINDRFWVFAAATTDVGYRLRVTDLDTGEIREYFNPLGNASPAITDSRAFATCP